MVSTSTLGVVDRPRYRDQVMAGVGTPGRPDHSGPSAPFDRFALAVTATRCSGSPRKFAVGALAVAWPLPAAAPVRVGQRNHMVHVELAWMLYHRSGERGPAIDRFRRGRHQLSGSRRRRGSPAAELPGVSPVSPRPRRSAAPSGSDRSRGRRAGSRRRRARG